MSPVEVLHLRGKSVEIVVLSGILALVVGGCVCVVWAARGGPRWVRGVARVMLVVGELARLADPGRKSSGQNSASGQNTSGDGS